MKIKSLIDKIILQEMKSLRESSFTFDRTKSYTQNVQDWFKSKGLTVEQSPDSYEVFKDGRSIFKRTTNSFFRSSHLDSFVNQVCKILSIKNDFKQ